MEYKITDVGLSNGIRFTIYHTFQDDALLTSATETWLEITNDYTVRSLVNFLRNLFPSQKIYTEKKFNELKRKEWKKEQKKDD